MQEQTSEGTSASPSHSGSGAESSRDPWSVMVEDVAPRLENFGYWTPTQVADWYEDAGYPRPTTGEALDLIRRAAEAGLGGLAGDTLVSLDETWATALQERV